MLAPAQWAIQIWSPLYLAEANTEFQKVAQWMRANRLMVHPEKTKNEDFCNRQKSKIWSAIFTRIKMIAIHYLIMKI